MMNKTNQARKYVFLLWVMAISALAVTQFTSCKTTSNDQANSSPTPSASTTPATAGMTNAQGIGYVPVNPSMYVDSAVIGKWSQDFNDQAIEEHAWQIWAAINADSGRKYNGVALPVWETWFSEFEVFCVDPLPPPTATPAPSPAPGKVAASNFDPCAFTNATGEQKGRPFHLPRQVTTRTATLSFNKYNREFLDFVHVNKYYSKETLEKLNASFASDTPLEQRHIADPPRKGIMLKPTFWIIKPDVPSPMPIWQGPGLQINGTLEPKRPVDLSWTNIVLVDPTGKADNSKPITRTVISETGSQQVTTPAGAYKVVPLSSFYYVTMTEEDVKFIQGGNAFQLGGTNPTIGGMSLNDLKAGDLALLVGMHVTTAEWEDFWTWQTFWWTPTPETTGHPGVNPPFTNFNSVQAYYMIGKDGQPHIAFNPHLETPIQGPIFMDPTQRGSHSNCMTCHRAAAFPSMSNDPNPSYMVNRSYIATGNLQRNDPVWFKNRVSTTNMWTMILETMPQGWSPASSGGATPINKPKKTP